MSWLYAIGTLVGVLVFTIGLEWGMGSAGRMFIRMITGGVTLFGAMVAVFLMPLELGFSGVMFGGIVIGMVVFVVASVLGWRL